MNYQKILSKTPAGGVFYFKALVINIANKNMTLKNNRKKQ